MTSPPSSTLTAPTSVHDRGYGPPPPVSPRHDSADADLGELPAPPRRERTVTVLLMLVTALAAAWMSVSLVGEARYAFAPGQLLEVGDLTRFHPGADLANRYVRANSLLGTKGAIRYGRPAEGESFRLAPVAGNESVWVEIRVPEGFEGPRFVPPTVFAGRLVPFAQAGVRYARLREVVRERTQAEIPSDAWVLVDGSSPRASRWAMAMALLFAGFAAWNVGGVARLVGKVRDADGRASPRPTA